MIRLILAMLFIFFTHSSQATLINEGDYVRDSESDLQWLDLNFTFGKSFNEAIAEYSHLSFRAATQTEVEDLFYSLTHTAPSLGLKNRADDFFNYFVKSTAPYNVITSDVHYLYGNYLSDSGIMARSGILRINNPYDTDENGDRFIVNDLTGISIDDSTWGPNGIFLVREAPYKPVGYVPEPSTYILLALGLVGLGFRRLMPKQ